MKTKPFPLPAFAVDSRVDTVIVNIHEAYKVDSSFFKANPERSMIIRLRLPSETASTIDVPELLRMPSVWMLVHRMAPVWLGKQFWGDPLSDNDTAHIVAKCSETYGMDRDALEGSNEAFTKYHAEKNGTVE
jgi:hypothetical protein